jgi:3-dehydroquinate synthase II
LKEIWIEIPETVQPDDREELFTVATEASATLVEGNRVSMPGGKNDVALLESASETEISELRREGKRIAVKIAIKGKEDEDKAVEAATLGADYLVVDCRDWRVIPLENIIARTRGKTKLIAQVSNAEEARTWAKSPKLLPWSRKKTRPSR